MSEHETSREPAAATSTGRDAVSLSGLIKRAVRLDWTEAIAIAQGAAETAIAERGSQLPALDAILITSSGSITFTPGSRRSAEEPVASYGALLKAIVPEDKPAPLRLTLSQLAHGDERFQTLDDCVRTLAYFERPDRAQLIRDVYERWRALPAPDAAAAATTDAKPEKKPVATPRRRMSRRRRVAVAALLALLASGAGGWLLLGGTSTEATVRRAQAGALVARARNSLEHRVASAFAWLSGSERADPDEQAPGDASAGGAGDGLSSGAGDEADAPAMAATSSPGPASGATADAPPPAGSAAATRAPGRAEPDPDGTGVDDGTDTAGVRAAGPVADGTPAAGPAWGVVEAPPTAGADLVEPADATDAMRIYDAEDVDVTPPVMIRPQLPTTPPPGTRIDDLAVVEVVVAADGSVEAVKLISGGRSVHDAMMLSAIKTWQFRPALRGDHPAPYRLQMWLTQR